MKIGTVVLASLCLIPTYASAEGHFLWGTEGSFDKTLTVSGTVDLDVSTGSGSINIRSGAGNRVEIHGRIQAGDFWWWPSRDSEETVHRLQANPPIEQSGSMIRIGKNLQREGFRNVSISYDIVMPAQANLRSHSGSGSQRVEGINGRVEVGTGSGSINLREINGDVDAITGSGSIRGTSIRGGLHMRTGSGGISVQGEQTGRWEIGTGSGGVDVDLPSNAAFDLNAHTGSGGIDVRFPMTLQGAIRHDRHNVTGKVGGGTYTLNVRTGSGHIRIE